MANGADALVATLLANGVDTCFANPGTSEMHFVAALDRNPEMRCILGLFEGVVTGAADGYARITDKPASTLLHLGPGLSYGIPNLHNARRARIPVINIVGDHATWHLPHDAPLTSDIDSIARPVSAWYSRAETASEVAPAAAQAIAYARENRAVATLVLHADAAWTDLPEGAPLAVPAPAMSDGRTTPDLAPAIAALRQARNPAIILSNLNLSADLIEKLGHIAAHFGAALFTQLTGRVARGRGIVPIRVIPVRHTVALEMLGEIDVALCIGGRAPVSFFAYPGERSELLPDGAKAIEFPVETHDPTGIIEALLEVTGSAKQLPQPGTLADLLGSFAPDDALTPDVLSAVLAEESPEGAVIVDESLTSAGRYPRLAPAMRPHDHLPLTGGAIGIGIPLATGAAIAAPARKVITLQADGSALYTIQGLWTQARERLDVVTIILSNRAYAVLRGEMRKVGVGAIGRNARAMMDLDDPALDWCALAEGMGVPARRAASAAAFRDALRAGLAEPGPFVVEAVL